MKPGDALDIQIDQLGSRGEGIGRIDSNTIYVGKTAPGDQVRVRLKQKIKGRWIAELVEVLKPGPDRQTPACRHFVVCGGCDFQHLPYSKQIEWKLSLTKHWINRSPLAKAFPLEKIEARASADVYGYRHRVRCDIKDHQPAYHLPRSKDLMLLEECPVLVPELWKKLSHHAEEKENTTDFRLSEPLQYELDGRIFQFDENCFTQANLSQNRAMHEVLSEEISKCTHHNEAWDLFAGIGNFSLPLIKNFKHAISVEAHPASVQFGQKNVPEAQWIQKDVRQALRTELSNREADFVVLDPARAGALHESRILSELKIERIFYISCQLDSLIRDLTALLKNRRFSIDRWVMLDLFPQTRHIESLVSLKTSR